MQTQATPVLKPLVATTTPSNGGPFGLPWWVVLVACGIYVLSPIDFLPELLLGCIGVPDDIGVLGFGIYSLVRTLSGSGPPRPSATPAAAAQEPRTVVVPARAAPPPQQVPGRPEVLAAEVTAPRSAPSVYGLFAVQVLDEDGTEVCLEVEARDAEAARATVRGMGADGRLGKVRLKRLLGTNGAEPRLAGGSDVSA